MIKFLKDWTLIIAMLSGIAGYFAYSMLPVSQDCHILVNRIVTVVQPVLIFSMLFLTFTKIKLSDLKLQQWHFWILLIQSVVFVVIGCVLISMPQSALRVILEGTMICMICPTATAGAVITNKLGGNVNNITTYTALINIAAAILIPLLVPFVHPNPDLGVVKVFLLILVKVFPLLLFPLVLAVLLRKTCRGMIEKISTYQDVSFYLWALALALATAVTTRSIVHTHVDVTTQLWLVAVSLICCVLQFWLGRKIGAFYGDKITAGQSFGQKNTVLAIWIGYTFFTPITAVVGGFYSIWHNVVNSYQLYQHSKTPTHKEC